MNTFRLSAIASGILLSVATTAVSPALAIDSTVTVMPTNGARSANSLVPANSRNVLLRQSYSQMLQGNYDTAIKSQIRAVKADNNSVSARRYLAYSLLRTGALSEAVDQLNALLLLTKPTAIDKILLGEACLQAKDFKQAEYWFQDSLNMIPNFEVAKAALARTAVQKKMYEEEQRARFSHESETIAAAETPVEVEQTTAAPSKPVTTAVAAKPAPPASTFQLNPWNTYRSTSVTPINPPPKPAKTK